MENAGQATIFIDDMYAKKTRTGKCILARDLCNSELVHESEALTSQRVQNGEEWIFEVVIVF